MCNILGGEPTSNEGAVHILCGLIITKGLFELFLQDKLRGSGFKVFGNPLCCGQKLNKECMELCFCANNLILFVYIYIYLYLRATRSSTTRSRAWLWAVAIWRFKAWQGTRPEIILALHQTLKGTARAIPSSWKLCVSTNMFGINGIFILILILNTFVTG